MTERRRVYAPKSNSWCFVLNNPEEDEKENLFKDLKEHLSYAIWQLEEGERTHTIHCQGYMILKQSRNLNWIKNHISSKMRLDLCRGSAEANQKYCTKSKTHIDGPWEFGEVPISEQGKRNDLHEVQKK